MKEGMMKEGCNDIEMGDGKCMLAFGEGCGARREAPGVYEKLELE